MVHIQSIYNLDRTYAVYIRLAKFFDVRSYGYGSVGIFHIQTWSENPMYEDSYTAHPDGLGRSFTQQMVVYSAYKCTVMIYNGLGRKVFAHS